MLVSKSAMLSLLVCRPATHAILHASTRLRPIVMLSSDVAPDDKPLVELIRERRGMRRAGLGVGGAMLLACASLGVGTGTLDGSLVAATLISGLTAAGGGIAWQYSRNSESRSPLDEASHFEVREAPGRGRGLFALRPIEEGTYLFDYKGEVLTEQTFFDRYPEADGRYVACLTDDYWIDGGDPERSNCARWMNHAPPARANVFWKKQTIGPKNGLAMHFYAKRAIRPDDELVFDYGKDYWEALGEIPM